MKRYRLKKSLFLLLPGAIGLGLLVATCALATEMEVPLPGMPANVSDPGVYIRYLFIFGLSAVGFLAVGGTVVGGIQYMLSGTLTSTEKARKTIISSLGGVFLLLCSWLLLSTIDPTLTNLSPMPPTPIKSSGAYNALGDLSADWSCWNPTARTLSGAYANKETCAKVCPSSNCKKAMDVPVKEYGCAWHCPDPKHEFVGAKKDCLSCRAAGLTACEQGLGLSPQTPCKQSCQMSQDCTPVY